MTECRIRLKIIAGLMLVSVLAWLSNLDYTYADSVVDNITIAVPEVCTLSSQTVGGETYSVSMNSGQYKNDIGDTVLSVYCNDTGGFSIYAIGYSNNEFGNNKMLTSDPNTYIATGTATSGNVSNWAMKLTAVTGSGTGALTPTIVSPFNNFTSVPSSYALAATVNPATDVGTRAQINATYAVYVSPIQPANTYTGKVRYTIVHPTSEAPTVPQNATAGCISYFPNAGNVADTMGDQCVSANASVELWASNYKRAGYGFVGWSDAYDYCCKCGERV